MPLVPLKTIIDASKAHGFGQSAFNVNTVDQAIAAIDIHEAMHAPLLLQGAELALGYIGGRAKFAESTLADKQRGAKILGEAVRKRAENSSIPIALHLDHGQNLETVQAAIDGGFTSVMYDGSALPYEENLHNTIEVVQYAHAKGVTVEAELGILAGVEDEIFSETSTYTNPLQALDFVHRSGVDLLAISYGTMHGPNKGKNVKLRKEIVITLNELFLNENLTCGLVSHGSSTIPTYLVEDLLALGYQVSSAGGIEVAQLQEVIHYGINKINIDTDIRMATTRNLMMLLHSQADLVESDPVLSKLKAGFHAEMIDPRVLLVPFMEEVANGFDERKASQQLIKQAINDAITEICGQIIVQFGMLGQAKTVEIVSLEEMTARYQN